MFIIHGTEGNFHLYKDIAYYLGDHHPVYGLQSQGMDGNEPLQTKFENMAESYIKEIKSVQPVGPYYIGGYCLGGIIAFEIAQQLKQAGDNVAIIAMIETYNLNHRPGEIPFLLRLLHNFQNIYFQMCNLFLSKSSERYKYFKEKTTIEISRYKIKINIFFSRIAGKFNGKRGLRYQHLLIDKINDRAQADYKPSIYDGKVTLFNPKKCFAGFNDQYYGWDKLAEKGVEINNMDVNPRGILNEPFVQVLADKLKKKIDEAYNNSVGIYADSIKNGLD